MRCIDKREEGQNTGQRGDKLEINNDREIGPIYG